MFFLMLIALTSIMFNYGLRIAAMVAVYKTRKLTSNHSDEDIK